MLKKILLGTAALCMAVSFISANIPDPLPEHFTVTQRLLSLTKDFDIKTKDKKLGWIHSKLLSINPHYKLYNTSQELEATAKARWFTWGNIYDVKDASKTLLGTVEGKVFGFLPAFEIISANGGEILATAKANFWGTKYVWKDPLTDAPMVSLGSPFFRLTDKWEVNIENPTLLNQKKIDPRLFILAVIFQSDLDAATRIISKKTVVDADFTAELNSLTETLSVYREILASTEPTESDFEQVEEKVEQRLNSKLPEALLTNASKASMLSGLQILLPLLDGVELTEGEKNALYLLIEYQAKRLKP